MQAIVKISLDNEMDLILAHKRTMKLAELCGLSISSQTTFATAVSEIARCAINLGKNSSLVLSIDFPHVNKKQILASVFDTVDLHAHNSEAISYAKKLMGDIDVSVKNGIYELRIAQHIPYSGLITNTKIESFKQYFKHEPPLSPYDEMRKKNILLIELADKLKESENQYRLLTDTLPLMMFATNSKGEVTYSNKWLNDFFETSDKQHVNNPSLQTWVHPQDYRTIVQEWDKAQVERNILRFQSRLKQKSKGEYLWHLVTIVPLNTDNTVATSWIGFFVDIHAQKLVEETLKDNKELKLLQQQLKEHQVILEQKIQELNLSNSDLEQFAYIASHDLQEPLRKIITFSTIIEKNQELNLKSKNYFDKIVAASLQMSNLIKDVLNYSRLAKLNDQFESTDLNHIVAGVKSNFDLLIQENKATIIADTLPTIKGIPLQLTQLFSNLFSNSLKFSKARPIISITSEKIEGKVEDSHLNPANTYVKITFADNGIGFDPQYRDQIFNIFQRLNNRELYSGTGIGLALCKKVMENHSGTITADAEADKGARFSMYFPVPIS